MKTLCLSLAICLLLVPVIPETQAARAPFDLDTPRTFPAIGSLPAWQARAAVIRDQVLVSCGLYPMPERPPLKPHIFGKIEREGYTIEKVYFETLPGFHLAGNLYRPRGQGPFPAILNPHGHWGAGRLADTREGSIAARCISFARQGMIAFSYDMIGYNDSGFADLPSPAAHRQFATNRADLLWNITPMGLQTWNSIRALDFLESLPDVDKTRLACTGESGGGTQTFMLGAIDPRLAAQAPVVMVSHSMQGGCVCENAPGLRVDFSNMEISAAAAPRPQFLVAATGDWTRATLTVEGPAIARIYDLFAKNGACGPDTFGYKRFDYGHNYNQESREAVYEFFGRWLLKHPQPATLKELPYVKEPDPVLRVLPDGPLPGTASRQQLADTLRQRHRERWHASLPANQAELKQFKTTWRPAWARTLQLHDPAPTTHVKAVESSTNGSVVTASLRIWQEGREIHATYQAPTRIISDSKPRIVVIAGRTDASDLKAALHKKGIATMVVDVFSSTPPVDQFSKFFSTYNRTLLQDRVADLLLACSAASQADPRQQLPFEVVLAGFQDAGPWALLAAPGAAAVVADCANLALTDEQALLAPNLFCPGILNLGGFDGLPLLAAPNPMLLHNTGGHFKAGSLQSTYAKVKAAKKIRVESARLEDSALVKWASGL